jgi:hypothetical protein
LINNFGFVDKNQEENEKETIEFKYF